MSVPSITASSKAKAALTTAAQRRQANAKKFALAKQFGSAKKFSSKPPAKKYKGKYIGPDKYKGVAQQGKKSYKGKYAGPDKYKGRVPNVDTNAIKPDVSRYKSLLDHMNAKKKKVTPTNQTPANPEPGMQYAQ